MTITSTDLGSGDTAARPDMDDTGNSGGGQSGGGARVEPVEDSGGGKSPGGQTDPAYRGGDNANATREGGGD